MANNFDHEQDMLVVYPCTCGETLCLEPGQILQCCADHGWEKELEDS
jgi:hypothetical protein